MVAAARRSASLPLYPETLDQAKELGINVTEVAEDALEKAVSAMKHKRWLEENSDAFDAQREWHEQNGHPLADIVAGPVSAAWKS
ncbi:MULTISPECIES: type II toxin-antitoxin system CcdA family antitoxin [unclassified Roseibium]|uniref:type II toxin-antitoxin system CcdA family antitoxin n=1 Tax=unclassified Roseibium TaxID=2629323 RepID=UPI0027402DBD|nr:MULTISPECIES: type II toxin-antitoxin system CcdA family antitoxin [unclassified Roseibium]